MSLASKFSVTRMLPSGPVIRGGEVSRRVQSIEPSGAKYAGGFEAEAPVLPFLVFGLTYETDLVIVTDHPDYDMHELARIATPEGDVWIAKDARAGTGEQLVVADIDGIDDWLPEVPLCRRREALHIEDTSDAKYLDLRFQYRNWDGLDVDLHYRGKRPTTLQMKRNGSTMGHSRNQVMAVLHLPHLNFAKSVEMSIDGQRRKIHRVAGLVPMQMALRQTQGGIGQADYRCKFDGGVYTTVHQMESDHVVRRQWNYEHGNYVQHDPLRSLSFDAGGEGEPTEIRKMKVWQWTAHDSPTFEIWFDRALPDLRRPLAERWSGTWGMNVGDGIGHAVGDVSVVPQDGGCRVEVTSRKPWWVADRKVVSEIRWEGDGSSAVQTVVEPV